MTARSGALLLLLLWATGCPRPAATPPSTPPAPRPEEEAAALRPEVQKLAAEAEALLKAQNEQIWATWTSGQKPELAASYQAHPALFTPESIHQIERLRQHARDPAEIRALTSLLSHFAGEYLAAQLSELTDAVSNLETSATFTASGKEYPYRDLDKLLASERSGTRRRALYQGATAAVQRLSATVRRREEKKAELVAALGYPSYEAYGAELRQVDPAQLALLAEQVLAITEPAYLQVLDRMAPLELEVPRAQVRRCDFPRLFRAPAVDGRFPAADLLPRAELTVEGMGLKLSGLSNLRVDALDVAGKPSRALAIGVEIPSDVRLSVRPVAGLRAQAALLGEVGRALHLAFTRPSMRFELRALGPGSASAAYAFLFEDLVEDPIWLEEHAGFSGDALDRLLSTQAAILLQRIRVTAGRILYELQLRRRGLQDARELYAPIMSRAYGVPFGPDDEERALADLEDFYASADDFLAWFLAGQIQAQMKARYGPAWWHNPAAAAFLEALWGRGQSVTAREVVGLIGEERLRPDVLLLRLSTMLKVPISVPANFGRELELNAPAAAPDGGTPDGR
ncbi:MAG TPA: chromosome segregation protein SMC [Myxococcales bacterium]|nr:chromosome segregation protein SMC [Myxococcales bacterium]